MRVVLDNSVILRGLMNPASTWGELLARWQEYVNVSTNSILDEAIRALRHRHLRERLLWASVAPPIERIQAIFDRAEMISDPPPVHVCRDADDDKLFACAVAGDAAYIVSEDDDVLAIAEYEGVRTIRTAAFLRVLDSQRS